MFRFVGARWGWGATILGLFAGPSVQGPTAPGLQFELEYVDGRVARVAAADLAQVDGGRFTALTLRVLGAQLPAEPPVDRVEVELRGGDRLAGGLAGGSGERLLVRLAGDALLPLPIDGVSSVVFPARIPLDPGVALEAAAEGDRLFRVVANRLDRVDGTIEGFDADGVRFESLVGSVRYGWEQVAALFVEPLGAPAAAAGGEGAVTVDLFDGSRLRGRWIRADAAELALEVDPGGVAVELPWTVVGEVSNADGQLQYLSELPPTRAVDAAPFGDDLGMVWPHRVDRAVTGEPLQVGERRYFRGLGVHGPSRLEWELEPGWRVLRGEVGIDDSVLRLAARGSVVFEIWLDGERVYSSGLVRGGEGARAIPELELAGRRQLALVVDVAEGAHVADRADWLRLRLVR
jgi:hypothetical protein